MDIKMIEGMTFEVMREKFEEFACRIRHICGKKTQEDEWLDNEDVCLLLGISKRTLQSYRDKGVLAYSQTGHKCFYKASDVEKLLEMATHNAKGSSVITSTTNQYGKGTV